MDNRIFTFITTNSCGARCAHCMMNSGPGEPDRLSYSQIKRYVDDLVLEKGYQVVVFTGGECTHLGDDLLEAIAYCTSEGLVTRVVTNSEWATDDETAVSFVRKLRECGLREMNLSYDDFHRVWVPEKNVLSAWKACKGQGFDSVVLALASGPRSKVTPEYMEQLLGAKYPRVYDDKGNPLPLPPATEDGTIYLIANNSIVRVGRGRSLRAEYLSAKLDKNTGLLARCGLRNRGPVVLANGNLAACCGLNATGNRILEMKSSSDMMNDDQRAVAEAIVEIGPEHLKQLAISADIDVPVRDQYSSICEICEDITTHDQTADFLLSQTKHLVENTLAVRAIRKYISNKTVVQANR